MRVSDFVRLVIDVCRMRRGPQDIPYSPTLLIALLVASTVLDVVVGGLLGATVGESLFRALLFSVILLGFTALALGMRHRRGRFVQAVSAMVACGLAISLLQAPLALLIGSGRAAAGETTVVLAASALHYLLVVGLFAASAWQLLIFANILRAALQIAFAVAIALVFSWFFAFWAIGSVIEMAYA